MRTLPEPAREIPVAVEADVVVCGGGPGGFPAAIAAARHGARTVLIERYGFMGGLATAGLPPGSLGFVYLPALAGVTLASICTAPLGARLAHRLPVKRLKRAFAFFLLLVATKLLLELL